jgi:hypothetical protein
MSYPGGRLHSRTARILGVLEAEPKRSLRAKQIAALLSKDARPAVVRGVLPASVHVALAKYIGG